MTGGTGLGLSIVKHIAERNECQIHLDSELWEGTTVTVFIKK
jgi:signal transduction histidine kinase